MSLFLSPLVAATAAPPPVLNFSRSFKVFCNFFIDFLVTISHWCVVLSKRLVRRSVGLVWSHWCLRFAEYIQALEFITLQLVF